MSVVAWDGRTLAADKQSVAASKLSTCTKIRKIKNGEVLAWTGDMDKGLLLAKWYEDGANPEQWPEFQKDKERWCRLIVAFRGNVKIYEQQPVSMRFEDAFSAWGAGQDFAIGAMAMGADAKKAVEITNEFSESCGKGVDAYES